MTDRRTQAATPRTLQQQDQTIHHEGTKDTKKGKTDQGARCGAAVAPGKLGDSSTAAALQRTRDAILLLSPFFVSFVSSW
jgi:hypothetical protein